MRVDFHVHSTASDGTMSPSELVAAAEAQGISAMALTDHDNTDGIAEFLSIPSKVRRVAGVELSIDPGRGFDKFHLLGLGIDPDNAQLKNFLKRILDGRNERNERIVANFLRIGIDLGGEIDRYAHGEVLARPHFAAWLMEHGYAASVAEAFQKYLLPDSPEETRCYEERWHPSQKDAFEAVHSAGGICVMAHPKYWRRDWKDAGIDYAAAEVELRRLKTIGLDGLEAHYQADTIDEDVAFTAIADRVGLVKTAGSDFHGAHKPNIHLGMEVSEAYMASLLGQISRQS